jgi:hypothetical protein
MMRVLRWLRELVVWAMFCFGVAGVAGMLLGLPKKESRLEVHKFDQEMCQYTVELPSGDWERTSRFIDTYRSLDSVKRGESSEVHLQFLGTRSSGETQPRTLFDAGACSAQDVATDTTPSGLTVLYQAVQCPAGQSSALRGPAGSQRLYATVKGRWISLGAALYGTNKDSLLKRRPQLAEILRSFKHQCDFEFRPAADNDAGRALEVKAAENAAAEAAAAAAAAAAATEAAGGKK